MKSKNFFGMVALLIIGAVFGAVLVSGYGYDRPALAEVQIGNINPPITAVSPEAQAFNDAFVNVAEKVTPSIVQITVISKVKNKAHDAFRFFFDIPEEQETMGGGSGVLISKDGYILTNNHVVENATSVSVTLKDNRKYDAEVVGTDPLTDLAVIKVEGKDLPAAHMGNSDELKVGTWVMAIGNPLALTSTVTAGIVSAIGRSINIIKNSSGIENFIQTDAAINPGNSGGALVDLNGSVIGINTAIATNGMSGSYIGYGFAIPVNMARRVAEDLIANGKVNRGYIGVMIQPVDDNMAKAVGLDKPTGVLIQDITKDGSASEEDIQPGDIILKVDKKTVNKPNELQSYVASKRAGDKITLTLYRDGDTIKRTVELKAREDDEIEIADRKAKVRKNEKGEIVEMHFDKVGMSVKNMTDKQLKSYEIENGILITDVKRFGKAFQQGLQHGDIIIEADRKEIEEVSDFENILESKRGEAILLKILDGRKRTRFVGLEIPKE